MWGCFLMSGVKILHFLKDWWKSIPIHQNYTMALMKLYFTSHANVIFRWENPFKSFTIVYMDNENVSSSKKLKNAKYLHRPLQRYASLVYGSNKFWFCLIVWDGMGNWLHVFLVITYISSRHQSSGYYTRTKAVSYTRPTVWHLVATSVITRLLKMLIFNHISHYFRKIWPLHADDMNSILKLN